ncbi:hypothetical protein B4Q13_22625 [Lacticaseibacillus rhamnosus]
MVREAPDTCSLPGGGHRSHHVEQGVGGASFATELARVRPLTGDVKTIKTEELPGRGARAPALMRGEGVEALYLGTSSNPRDLAGIADPAIDAMIEKVIAAENRQAMVTACRALDRLIWAGRYWIPHWDKAPHWLVHWDVFGRRLTTSS